jgi:hypothetical protein
VSASHRPLQCSDGTEGGLWAHLILSGWVGVLFPFIGFDMHYVHQDCQMPRLSWVRTFPAAQQTTPQTWTFRRFQQYQTHRDTEKYPYSHAWPTLSCTGCQSRESGTFGGVVLLPPRPQSPQHQPRICHSVCMCQHLQRLRRRELAEAVHEGRVAATSDAYSAGWKG